MAQPRRVLSPPSTDPGALKVCRLRSDPRWRREPGEAELETWREPRQQRGNPTGMQVAGRLTAAVYPKDQANSARAWISADRSLLEPLIWFTTSQRPSVFDQRGIHGAPGMGSGPASATTHGLARPGLGTITRKASPGDADRPHA